MSPRQRIELAGHRGLVALLAALDALGAYYLITTPDDVFATSQVWEVSLGLFGTMAPIGWAYALVAALAAVGLLGVPLAARVGLFIALAPWGVIVASFLDAWTHTGLGVFTAGMAVVILLLHLASVGHFPERNPPTGR